jgi:hypothetical protein
VDFLKKEKKQEKAGGKTCRAYTAAVILTPGLFIIIN